MGDERREANSKVWAALIGAIGGVIAALIGVYLIGPQEVELTAVARDRRPSTSYRGTFSRK